LTSPAATTLPGPLGDRHRRRLDGRARRACSPRWSAARPAFSRDL